MKKDVAVVVFYKGSGLGSSNLTWDDLESLKKDLQQNYVASFKDTGGPQAGGIVDTIVEIFTNISFADIVQLIRDGLIFDFLTRGNDSIILKPLITAFQEMEANAESWDYTQVRFNFDDTTVTIYGASNLFTSTVGLVFPEILKHYKNLKHQDYGYPTGIHIPVQKPDWTEENEWITPAGDGQEYPIDEYLQYWGLAYISGHERCIYDVQNEQITEGNWK